MGSGPLGSRSSWLVLDRRPLAPFGSMVGGVGLLCPLIHSGELRARYRCGAQGGLVFTGRHGLASASSGLLSCDAYFNSDTQLVESPAGWRDLTHTV
jgi:hypothetical protein